jgi:hypothetical protein
MSVRKQQINWLFNWLFIVPSLLSFGLVSPTATAQSLEAPLEAGISIEDAVQERVNEERVVICEGYRCEGWVRPIRILIEPGDTLLSLQERLADEMLVEVDRAFSANPNLQRVIVEGYVYKGTEAFVTVELPLLTLFVGRHNWVTNRFSLAENAIAYPELLSSVQVLLDPSAVPASSTNTSGSSPALPPLPSSGGSQRRPITPPQ